MSAASYLTPLLIWKSSSGRICLRRSLAPISDLTPWCSRIGLGNLKYAPDSWPPGNRGAALLKGEKYYYLFKDPATQPCLSGPYTGAQAAPVPGVESAALGRLYLVEKAPQGLGRLLPTYDTVSTFSLLSYFMALVGFAGICAITARYQRQSQELRESRYASELEARELRIQNLETNIGAADLRLELLDRSQEQAQDRLRGANETIEALAAGRPTSIPEKQENAGKPARSRISQK